MVFIVHTNYSVKSIPLAFDNFCVYNWAMKKRGRPPKPALEKRVGRLDLRVSEAEKTAFQLAAENANQELSVWIRIQLHRAAGESAVTADENPAIGTSNAKRH